MSEDPYPTDQLLETWRALESALSQTQEGRALLLRFQANPTAEASALAAYLGSGKVKGASELATYPVGNIQQLVNIAQAGVVHIHGARRIPFLAPPRLRHPLIGRQGLIEEFTARLFSANVVALAGLPGVGKTALAQTLVYERALLNHFHDGILWAGLGQDADVPALLTVWAVALGIPREDIARAPSVERRAQRIQAEIGMRQMLLVIDDAWSSQTALAFKLGGPNCAYLLTSRFEAVGEEFAANSTTIVRELNSEDGLRLLTQLAPFATGQEPEQAQNLVREVDGLPLALILLGRHLRQLATTQSGVASTLSHLRDIRSRLQIEQPQEPLGRHPSFAASTPLSLLASIQLSTQSMPENARAVLTALSLFPPKPNSFSREAATETSGADEPLLAEVRASGLLESSGSDRYTLHKTIADYARLGIQDVDASRRYVQYYVALTSENYRNFATLDAEYRNIIYALDYAASLPEWGDFAAGANSLYLFQETHGLYQVAIEQITKAISRTETAISPELRTRLLIQIGRVYMRVGDIARSETFIQDALELAKALQDLRATADAKRNLATIQIIGGNYASAVSLLQAALGESRASGDEGLEAEILSNLGALHDKLGDTEVAKPYYQQALSLGRRLARDDIVSAVLHNLAGLYANVGERETARLYFEENIAIARRSGNRERIGQGLMNLGAFLGILGDYQAAEKYSMEALSLARDIGNPQIVAHTLENLAGIAGNCGAFERSKGYASEALEIARLMRHSERIAAALMQLGLAKAELGELTSARRDLEEGLAEARRAGNPEITAGLAVSLGRCLTLIGDYDHADESFAEGLQLARGIKNLVSESAALCGLGENLLHVGNFDRAWEMFSAARTIAEQLGAREQQGIALFGLARVAMQRDEPVLASELAGESFDVLRTIGSGRASEVQRWIEARA
jgi:tetratricopeptide (TPR) repeat protein